MITTYREIEKGELLVVGCDTSYGANDYCVAQFYSVTKYDIPMVYRAKVACPTMTDELHPILESISVKTNYKPVVAYERQNGGAFEMERLNQLNRLAKYTIFKMPTFGVEDIEQTRRLGWDTNSATRPEMLSNMQGLINSNAIRIYDEPTIKELFSFVVKDGKAQAENNSHDDCVMSLAIALKVSQYVEMSKQQLNSNTNGSVFITQTYTSKGRR
jgi:hypothetical protein